MARELHKRGIPVIYYVSPQLWAWRQSRIELVRKYVRKMLVIFPFEEKFYRERGIEAEFVGHPLADIAVADGHARGIRATITNWIRRGLGSRCCPAAARAKYREFIPSCCRQRNF